MDLLARLPHPDTHPTQVANPLASHRTPTSDRAVVSSFANPLQAGGPRLGQCSGMTPERVGWSTSQAGRGRRVFHIASMMRQAPSGSFSQTSRKSP